MESDGPAAHEDAQGAGPERVRAEPTCITQRLREDVRHHQERLREIAGEVAATESHVAATFRAMAEQARGKGRLEDARRLETEADKALFGAELQRRRAQQGPPGPPSGEPDQVRAEQRARAVRRALDEATRRREEAALRRDEAAFRRDEAALRRDEAAVERDQRAAERAEGAARRAADDRTGDDAGPGSAQREQLQAARDRDAARLDRDAARDDREAAARDRAAAEADREQSEVDRETRY
ncbi:hypothetical protein ACI79D_09575 [Geodermatophilus sp. SYSU D00708]